MDWTNLAYIAASILFVLGIKGLGRAESARRGNQLSAVGMTIAILVTIISEAMEGSVAWGAMLGALVVGSTIGLVAARRVAMTGMPEMVALFNGFGGLASLLVGWAEAASGDSPVAIGVAVVLAIAIGGVTFTGSFIAWAKLSGKMKGAAIVFPGQKAINALVALALVAASVAWVMTGSTVALYITIGLALLIGVLGVIPIGGGDMPVGISLLNSFSGLAASAAGFVILNNVLIVAGCLVGASGLILTVIMCKGMNRTLTNVLFSGFGASGGAKTEVEGEMKAISTDDAYYVLESARSVVVIPGYGMAVAQAQHAVKELAAVLEENGTEVRFAIHPVAGRMPGHMNVLLAESDVPYESLREMDDVNPTMGMVDVALVVGANDVVNPSAAEDPSSPIYGMPIINAHEAHTVFALKRGQGAGFSGLVNTLFFRDNTRMIYGDAKATLTALVDQFKG